MAHGVLNNTTSGLPPQNGQHIPVGFFTEEFLFLLFITVTSATYEQFYREVRHSSIPSSSYLTTLVISYCLQLHLGLLLYWELASALSRSNMSLVLHTVFFGLVLHYLDSKRKNFVMRKHQAELELDIDRAEEQLRGLHKVLLEAPDSQDEAHEEEVLGSALIQEFLRVEQEYQELELASMKATLKMAPLWAQYCKQRKNLYTVQYQVKPLRQRMKTMFGKCPTQGLEAEVLRQNVTRE